MRTNDAEPQLRPKVDGSPEIYAQFNWWGSSSGSPTVVGDVDYAAALLASTFSESNLVFADGGILLLVNADTGEFSLYDNGTLIVSGNGARVQNGKLKVHVQLSKNGKVDVIGMPGGSISVKVKTANDKQTRRSTLMVDMSGAYYRRWQPLNQYKRLHKLWFPSPSAWRYYPLMPTGTVPAWRG